MIVVCCLLRERDQDAPPHARTTGACHRIVWVQRHGSDHYLTQKVAKTKRSTTDLPRVCMTAPGGPGNYPLRVGLFRQDYFRPARHTLMPDQGDSKSMLRTRIVIDRVRKDGLVFASDYSDCDHSMEGFRKVMFRAKEVTPIKTGAAYSLEYETEDILKPFVQKSRSGKTTYSYPQRFYHKITNVTLVSTDPDPDLLLDL